MNDEFVIRIHNDETKDYFELKDKSVNAIMHKAFKECRKRGWDLANCWSEELEKN